MALRSFRWPDTDLTYSVNGDVVFPRSEIPKGFDAWSQVSPFTFTEVTGPAHIVIVDLDQLRSFTPGYDGALGLSVTYTNSADVPFLSYIGLDASRLQTGTEGWVFAHEAGHSLGGIDNQTADPNNTIFSYTPGTGRPQAWDIEDIQDEYGASPRDNVIIAGNGSGKVSGGAGADLIYAEGGVDLVYGNQGADTLHGGEDSDTLFGGQDADVIYGNAETDIIYGNTGGDILYGGQGNDVLYGGQDADTLFGGQGDDLLFGNKDTDLLWGGTGADTFIGVGPDMIGDFNPAEGDVIQAAMIRADTLI